MRVCPLQEVDRSSNRNRWPQQAQTVAATNRSLGRCASGASKDKTNAKISQALIKRAGNKWILPSALASRIPEGPSHSVLMRFH